MGYELFGRAHAALVHAFSRDERGQGTVEYVGLILLLAVVLAGVVRPPTASATTRASPRPSSRS